MRRAIVAISTGLALAAGVAVATTRSGPSEAAPVDPVLVGAGEVGACEGDGDEATAALLDGIEGTVLAIGGLAGPAGTEARFVDCYGPTWGRHLTRTRPAPGDAEHGTPGAAPYFDYFGPYAGPPGLGYYSYERGAWHVIALDSAVDMGAGSFQSAWLTGDLASYGAECTLAYWQSPRFSSSTAGGTAASDNVWRILLEAGVDVVVNGGDRHYERFDPQDADGRADDAGIREFVVGTGGAELEGFGPTAPNSAVRDSSTPGVLALTLREGAYDWGFVPAAGGTFTDAGSAGCVDGGAASRPVAVDTFDREVDGGWGRTTAGVEYELIGARADFAVADGVATMVAPPGTGRAAVLDRPIVRDVDLSVRASSDVAPTGGGHYVAVVVRRAGAVEYRARLRFEPDGVVTPSIARVTHGGRVVPLAVGEPDPDLVTTAGDAVRMRVEVTGSDPTTLRMRVWSTARPEPSRWVLSVTDDTAALQDGGAIGVYTYVSSTASAPVTVALDDFLAVEP